MLGLLARTPALPRARKTRTFSIRQKLETRGSKSAILGSVSVMAC